MTHTMKGNLIGLAALAAGFPALAQPGLGGMQPPRGRPAFMKQLFPPQFVMRHQGDIGLTDEQREAITAAIKTTQGEVVDIQWRLQDEEKKLTDLLAAPRVDEAAGLAQAEKLMVVEQQMKRNHLALLIRIKNQLTPEQQEKLGELRPKRFGRRPPPAADQ